MLLNKCLVTFDHINKVLGLFHVLMGTHAGGSLIWLMRMMKLILSPLFTYKQVLDSLVHFNIIYK